MGIELNKKTFQDLIRQDLEWLAQQEPSHESAHIDTCLRWLRDDGYELLVDIQRLPSKPNAANEPCSEAE